MTPLEEKFSRKYFTNQRKGFFPCSFWRQMRPLVVRWGNGSISKLIVSVTEKYFTVAALVARWRKYFLHKSFKH